jgi:hypothetical protein
VSPPDFVEFITTTPSWNKRFRLQSTLNELQ